MKWRDMTDSQKHATLMTMHRYGGGFVHCLADAWTLADSYNRLRLENAFPELADQYGPDSLLHKDDA